jgi:CRISPR-associated endonuclease Cas1
VNQKRSLSRLALALAALLTVLLGAAAPALAQDGTPAAATPRASATIKKVAIITPAAKTNLGWDQQGADSLVAAANALGIEPIVQENGGYGDIAPALKDLKDQGAQLIICHASGYQTACPDFAKQENVPVAVIENPTAVTPGLVSDIETQAQEVAYLAGVAAGKATKTGTVAIVASGEPPTWNYMTVGFAEGLKATNGSARLIYSVITGSEDPYSDAAGAKRVTEQALAQGADVVFGMGDGASFGMIEAIRDYNKTHTDAPAKFIDVIGDKSKDYGDVLLTSVLFDYTGIYEQMINDLAQGTFGKTYTMDVKNGGVRLLDLPAGTDAAVTDAVSAAQKDIIAGKIKNCRTLLRRHGGAPVNDVLGQLAALAVQAGRETHADRLLGIEGTAARLYYEHFPTLVRSGELREAFSFDGRNRRPPRDRLNALISFVSSLLVKDTTIAAIAAGLDPHLGLFHRPRFGRPSLALDLAEEFRPLIADSVVMTAINNGEVRPRDFVARAGAVTLTDGGRRGVIAAYERRMTTELTHPVFGYKVSYRRALELQARLLAALLLGDTPEYRPLTTR